MPALPEGQEKPSLEPQGLSGAFLPLRLHLPDLLALEAAWGAFFGGGDWPPSGSQI
jgi:hypothetical protein